MNAFLGGTFFLSFITLEPVRSLTFLTLHKSICLPTYSISMERINHTSKVVIYSSLECNCCCTGTHSKTFPKYNLFSTILYILADVNKKQRILKPFKTAYLTLFSHYTRLKPLRNITIFSKKLLTDWWLQQLLVRILFPDVSKTDRISLFLRGNSIIDLSILYACWLCRCT